MTVRDIETLEVLRDEPELLAIADAVAATQTRRRQRPPRRLLVAVALRWGLNPNDLKIITALFVFAALVLPALVARAGKKARPSESAA